MANKRWKDSTTAFILKALAVPYSGPNLKLVYQPERFFNELENKSRAKKRNLKMAFGRMVRNGIVEIGEDGVPSLTEKGWRKARPFTAKHLGKNVSLIVIFDVPEAEKWKRNHFRRLLLELDFTLVQKSVWQSNYDHRELLKEETKAYGLEEYVKIFEAAELKLI